LTRLDPLYVANEGKLLAIIANEDVAPALTALRSQPLGESAVVIGEVVDEHPGIVMMKTRVGGTRVVDMLSGEQLPRICWNVAHTPGNIPLELGTR
jgi:hydrogenase expression/formation protein HypE